MTRKLRRRLALAAVAVSGTAFQVFPSGCGQYYAAELVTAFDFCAILNCSASTYFDLCEPVILLVDCPNVGAENP